MDRLATCVKSLAERNAVLKGIFSERCRSALSVMLEENAQILDTGKASSEKKVIANQPDESISFLQLFAKSEQGVAEVGTFFILEKYVQFFDRQCHTDFRFIFSKG